MGRARFSEPGKDASKAVLVRFGPHIGHGIEDLSKAFGRRSGLAIFETPLDVGVGHLDEPAERLGVGCRSRPQLDMAHKPAGALQQACRIGQRCTVKEAHVDVRREYIDVGEGRITQTGYRTAVLQELPDFVAALAHDLEPLLRDGSQFPGVGFHPGIDGGIALDNSVETQQLGCHRRTIFAFTGPQSNAEPFEPGREQGGDGVGLLVGGKVSGVGKNVKLATAGRGAKGFHLCGRDGEVFSA